MTGPTTIDGIVLTKTQIDALIVKLRELATPFDGGITGAAMVEAASALALLASRPAVPTYQVSAGGQWTTVTEAQYDAWSGKKRVALAASPAAPAQSCGDAEQADEAVMAQGYCHARANNEDCNCASACARWVPAPLPRASEQADEAVDAFLAEVRAELIRARAKFPGDRIMTIALAEEFGELCKAVLDESAANVRKEAVQTAVMCARVVLDGDGSVNDWRAERGLDPLVKESK